MKKKSNVQMCLLAVMVALLAVLAGGSALADQEEQRPESERKG